MKANLSEEETSFVSSGDIYMDLGFTPAEALEFRVRSEVYRELVRYIRQKRLTQVQIGALLGIHQPDVSHLMKGKVSKFSVGKLIQFASKLDLDARVTVTRRKVAGKVDLKAKAVMAKKKQSRDLALKAKAVKAKRETVPA